MKGPVKKMNEAYVTGRSPERALVALREVIIAEETEPIIDMYERAAWMSGATSKESYEVAKQSRLDRDELRVISADIKELVAISNTTHNKLCAEVRLWGQVNKAMEDAK